MQLSEQLFNRIKNKVPGGVHSNSRGGNPHPVYFKSARGPYLFDVDGNKYIDLIMGNGTVIFGHDYEPFNELFRENLPKGLVTGVETELSIEVSEKFLELVDQDQVRFSNTGTEGINHIIHMARAYTGKNDIALIEGAYNGWSDNVNVSCWPDMTMVGDISEPVSLPGSGGLDSNVIDRTLVIPFNRWDETEHLLRRESSRLACVIIEPVMIDIGFIEPNPAYLKKLRKLCDELNILLVFDELLTGFRMSLGGAQQYYGVKPDLSMYGKAIANGYMLSAVAGKKEVMEIAKPGGKANFVGTYNGHQVSLAAAKSVFNLLEDGTIHEELNHMTNQLKESFEDTCAKLGLNGRFFGRGGHIHWYFSDDPITSYRDAALSDHERFLRFNASLTKQDCLVTGKPLSHHKLSYMHKGEALEQLAQRMNNALNSL